GFEVASADGVYVPANVVVDGNTLLVSSPQVQAPKHVRYAWSDRPVPALYNQEGLPAFPFRSDAPAHLPSILGHPNPAAPPPMAELRLGNLFTDYMVLQQNATTTVWGWGEPGKTVSLQGSWSPQ